MDRSIWQAVNAGWTPRLQIDQVQGEISRKEPRVPTYRKRVDEIWLLVATNGIVRDSASSVDDDVLEHEYTTSIDGVVLLDEAMQRAVTLRIRCPRTAILHRKGAAGATGDLSAAAGA
jgi:hypothetical protein